MKLIQNLHNPDENLDLPMDLKNLDEKNLQTNNRRLLSNVFD